MTKTWRVTIAIRGADGCDRAAERHRIQMQRGCDVWGHSGGVSLCCRAMVMALVFETLTVLGAVATFMVLRDPDCKTYERLDGKRTSRQKRTPWPSSARKANGRSRAGTTRINGNYSKLRKCFPAGGVEAGVCMQKAPLATAEKQSLSEDRHSYAPHL